MTKTFAALLVIFFLIPGLVCSQQSPDEYLKVKVGADRTLVKYPGIVKYFKYLDEQSSRVKVTDEGKSTLGNEIILAAISSEENIKNLPQLLEINKKLTNPDSLTKEETGELLKNGRAFVLITCSLHATEIGASQMSMIFAYQLAITKDPEIKKYLDNVVILLMPSINPDGNIMVTEWYQKHLETKFENCRMPYLYHHYAGHDNNRDYYMLNLKESRVVNAVLHHRYFPHVYLDMHQMGSTGARMFVPPFKDPFNPNLPPIMLREIDLIGSSMALKLQENNKKGVASAYVFDAYWPGGTKNTAWYKNVVGLLTELASVRTATPIYVEPNELRAGGKGLPEYKPQINFPDPWQGGWWRLSDIIDYELISVYALLETAGKNRKRFLANYLKMGLDSIHKGKTEAPFGYVVPAAQWDEPAAARFLQKMEEHGVRLFKMDKDHRQGQHVYAKGDVIIPLAQPYRPFVKVMMEKQVYPRIKHYRSGPIMEPYDSSGWTLPILMGVKSHAIGQPVADFPMSPLTGVTYKEEKISGDGEYYVIPARFNRSVIAVNRLHKNKRTVFRYTGDKPGQHLSVGDFLVKTVEVPEKEMLTVLKNTGVSIAKATPEDKISLRVLKPTRIAIYQPYTTSMDEGWTRWVLDNFGFPFTIVHKKDFNPKRLNQFDTVIFADIGRETIVDGFPRRYRRYYNPEGSPPEYRGGIGKAGVKALKAFVTNGGTLILLDSSAILGIKDFGLPLRSVLEKVSEEKFSCPGSILRINVDNTDPIAWGMEKKSNIFFAWCEAFRTSLPGVNHIKRKVVAGFNNEGNHLVSGYLKGGDLLNRKVLISRFDYHQGNIIVLGGRVQHRSQTFGTFKFLFNAIYYAGLM